MFFFSKMNASTTSLHHGTLFGKTYLQAYQVRILFLGSKTCAALLYCTYLLSIVILYQSKYTYWQNCQRIRMHQIKLFMGKTNAIYSKCWYKHKLLALFGLTVMCVHQRPHEKKLYHWQKIFARIRIIQNKRYAFYNVPNQNNA